MTFERQQRVIPAHAEAVIRHDNRRPSPTLDRDCDAMRVSIERVLDKFLHDRSRPLHHFAGRDLVGNMFGK